jgi:hypothetical protein
MMSIFSPRSSRRPCARASRAGRRRHRPGRRPGRATRRRSWRGSRLAGDAADLDEPVGDLGHLELEERLDQLGISAREDHLRALRAGADLGDDGLDPGALLVALAVDLLGARQQRLDLAEVDEHVVAVACLLDDAGDDLALAVDVLLVHHRALGLADALLDHLLGRHRGDAAEVVRGDVGALDQLLGDLIPVELELVLVDQGVLLLPRLLLEVLELVDLRLHRLVEQPLLEILGDLDREDAELTLLVQLDGGVAGRAGSLLVGGQERVLQRMDDGVLLDSLFAFEPADVLDDLLRHCSSPTARRPGCPGRPGRTGSRRCRRPNGRRRTAVRR